MTPFQIEIVMHHNNSFAEFPRRSAPIYDETVAQLVADGLLEVDTQIPSESHIRTTPRGRAYCNMLCATPIPVMRWLDPRFEEANAK